LERVLEPEVMDGEDQAQAYANANFHASNHFFVDMLKAQFPDYLDHVLDIGCGPADVPILLLQHCAKTRATAIDASVPMLALARQRVHDAGLEERLSIQLDRLPDLRLKPGSFTTIYSKDMIHHLPDPTVLWHEIKRLAHGKTAICVMDLYRPQSQDAAWQIMRAVASQEAEILQKDFYNSLLAAFSLEEIETQIRTTGLNLKVEKINERHFLASGFVSGDLMDIRDKRKCLEAVLKPYRP